MWVPQYGNLPDAEQNQQEDDRSQPDAHLQWHRPLLLYVTVLSSAGAKGVKIEGIKIKAILAVQDEQARPPKDGIVLPSFGFLSNE